MERFGNLSEKEKSKIHFIHLNHTNPALNNESDERKNMTLKGFKISLRDEKFKL
jgi:pyrroloquinoline quinone biosynthesis protein B